MSFFHFYRLEILLGCLFGKKYFNINIKRKHHVHAKTKFFFVEISYDYKSTKKYNNILYYNWHNLPFSMIMKFIM